MPEHQREPGKALLASDFVKKWSWRETGLLILGLSALLVVWVNLWMLPTPDESTMIYAGFRVFRGDIPYQEFFEFVFPGSYYAIAAIMKLFGVSIVAIRLASVAMILTIIWLYWVMIRPYLSFRWYFLFLLMMWFFLMPREMRFNHHLLSHCMGTLALYSLWQYLGDRQEKRLYISGVFLGLCILGTQSVGGLQSICLGFFMLFYGFKQEHLKNGLLTLGKLALPAIVIVGGLYLYYYSMGALEDFWYATVVWLTEGSYSRASNHWYFTDGFFDMRAYLLSLPWHWDNMFFFFALFLQGPFQFLGMSWPVFVLWKVIKGKPAGEFSLMRWRILLLWASSIGFYLSMLSYPTKVMVATHGWNAYLLGFIVMVTLLRRSRFSEKWACTLISLCFAVHLLSQMPLQAFHVLSARPYVSFGTQERELLPNPFDTSEEVDSKNQVIRYINENSLPGKSLFVYNNGPEIYLLANRHNPTRFQYLISVYSQPKHIEEAADVLRKELPPFVIDNHLDDFYFTYDFRFKDFMNQSHELVPISSVLNEFYEGQKVGSWTLYRRKVVAADE